MSLSKDYYTIVVCDSDSKPTERSGETFYLVSGTEYSVMLFNHNPRVSADVDVFLAGKERDTFVLEAERGVKFRGTFHSPCELAFVIQLNQPDEQQKSWWWWPKWNRPAAVEPVVVMLSLEKVEKN